MSYGTLRKSKKTPNIRFEDGKKALFFSNRKIDGVHGLAKFLDKNQRFPFNLFGDFNLARAGTKNYSHIHYRKETPYLLVNFYHEDRWSKTFGATGKETGPVVVLDIDKAVTYEGMKSLCRKIEEMGLFPVNFSISTVNQHCYLTLNVKKHIDDEERKKLRDLLKKKLELEDIEILLSTKTYRLLGTEGYTSVYVNRKKGWQKVDMEDFDNGLAFLHDVYTNHKENTYPPSKLIYHLSDAPSIPIKSVYSFANSDYVARGFTQGLKAKLDQIRMETGGSDPALCWGIATRFAQVVNGDWGLMNQYLSPDVFNTQRPMTQERVEKLINRVLRSFKPYDIRRESFEKVHAGLKWREDDWELAENYIKHSRDHITADERKILTFILAKYFYDLKSERSYDIKKFDDAFHGAVILTKKMKRLPEWRTELGVHDAERKINRMIEKGYLIAQKVEGRTHCWSGISYAKHFKLNLEVFNPTLSEHQAKDIIPLLHRRHSPDIPVIRPSSRQDIPLSPIYKYKLSITPLYTSLYSNILSIKSNRDRVILLGKDAIRRGLLLADSPGGMVEGEKRLDRPPDRMAKAKEFLLKAKRRNSGLYKTGEN